MINAGHGVEQNHGGTVNGRGDHAHGVMMDGRPDDAQGQHGNAHGSADNVGDHVGNLLAPGVAGQLSLRQLCSFHRDSSCGIVTPILPYFLKKETLIFPKNALTKGFLCGTIYTCDHG